jgi:DNA-binding CsgD family transcriptional regulator
MGAMISFVAALSERDAEQLVDAVATLAAPLTLEELRADAVRVVGGLINCTLATWNEISASGIEIVGVPVEEPFPGARETFARLIVDHPVIEYMRRTNDGRPKAISDLWSAERFHASELYREFYAHIGTTDQLSFTVPSPYILIGIAMSSDNWGFSLRDHTMANLLRPHLLQAYRNAIANEQIRYLGDVVNNLSRERGEGIVMLGRHGVPVHWTPASTTLLAEWFPAGASGALPDELAEWLRSEDARPASPSWPLVFERGARRLVVRRLRSVEHADGDVILVSERRVDRSSGNLRLLGLSSRQSEVLRLVSLGLANNQIAAELGISIRTVEGHLNQAYARLGVSSRTAATSLVHQLELADEHVHQLPAEVESTAS